MGTDKRIRMLETNLALTCALLVVFLVFSERTFLYLAIGTGTVTLFVKPLGELITGGWLFVSRIMGRFVSIIVLAMVYFLVLVPAAMLSMLIRKKNRVRSDPATFFRTRSGRLKPDGFEEPW